MYMSTPETGGGHAPDQKSLMERLRTLFHRVLQDKVWVAEQAMKQAEEAGEKAHHKRAHHETTERREATDKRSYDEERERAYHEAGTADVEVTRAEIVREQHANEVWSNINAAIDDPRFQTDESRYLYNVITDVNLQNNLRELLRSSPGAAETIRALFTSGDEVHNNNREIIKLAQRLSYEAQSAGRAAAISPILDALVKRAQDLTATEFNKRRRDNQRQGISGPDSYYDILKEDKNIIITDPEKQVLNEQPDPANPTQSLNRWNNEIRNIMTASRGPVDTAALTETRSLITPDTDEVVKKIVAPVDAKWSEIIRRESTPGAHLSITELETAAKEIKQAESEAYPRDVPAGSEAYNSAVLKMHQQNEEKMDYLARKLAQRSAEQGPIIAQEAKSEDEFLLAMTRYKGRFGDLLHQHPDMYRLFMSTGERGGRFRNRVFLKIHSAVISDQRNASNENFGLYERSDFTSFIDLVRRGELEKIKISDTGESMGTAWADYYNTLSNTIRQSRDIDFWASQPAANIENYNKSLGMFQNEYTTLAMGLPGVEAAFRAYETTLKSIIDSNDGYLPPAMIEYSAARKGSFWDQRAREMLKQMIYSKTVSDLERDKITFLHKVNEDGHTLRKSGSLDLDKIDPDELQMYMVLAKGIGMASARYLEMIAQTKVPGSDNPELGMANFHSMPYEGLAKSLNFFNIFIQKWKIGSYKYFYLMNLIVPEHRRFLLNPDNADEAIKAYMAYQDGTFEDVYGPEAKRFMDSTNFSGISSAIGKDTTWRQFDTTIRWSDRQREKLGGGTLLALADRFVPEKVKEFMVTGKYREMYRQELMRENSHGGNYPTSGAGFDKLWQEYGMSKGKYGGRIQKEWEALQDIGPEKGRPHSPLAHEYGHAYGLFKKAYKARIWVQMAMRNPLAVGHALKIPVPAAGTGETNVVNKLHAVLVHDILGIPPEDTKYGEMYGKAGYGATPTNTQEDYMIAVMTLEGDLAAVRERAIRDGRDLAEQDFDEVIQDEARRKHAKEYWRRIRLAILGSEDTAKAQELYDEFGLKLMENGEDYEWDFHKIHGIEEALGTLEQGRDKMVTVKTDDGRTIYIPLLLNKAVNEDRHTINSDWIVSTDDMAMGEMDWLNLGSRQWIRRGGDIAAHEQGGNAVVKYLMDGLLPKPDKHELVKMLKEVRNAYSGDMIEAGWSVAANLAYMTDRLYSFDASIGKMGSPAQLYVWGTRRGVDAWGANARREFWDAMEHADVIPPHAHFYAYPGVDSKLNIHVLRDLAHANNIDVWLEIISLGVLLAIGITIWRGITAKDEEEGGGGGGGGGHH